MRYQGTVWKFGDNINTDMIIAGEHLGTSDPDILRLHCFAGADPEWASKVKTGDIVVGGKNFGCGSSREHAPVAIKAAGVSCIVAESFGAIFFRNAINVGLPVIICPEAAMALQSGKEILVDLDACSVSSAGSTWTFKKAGETITDILSAGGLDSLYQSSALGLIVGLSLAVEAEHKLCAEPRPSEELITMPLQQIQLSQILFFRPASPK